MHYQNRKYPFRTPPELMGEGRGRYPVAIIGAGPIGMAMAIDLALHGIRSVILDDNNMVSVGSRAICWAKRTLEIFDRLGIGDRHQPENLHQHTEMNFHFQKRKVLAEAAAWPERKWKKRPVALLVRSVGAETLRPELVRRVPELR